MAVCSYISARKGGDISPQVLLTAACATCAMQGICTKCAATCHRGHVLKLLAAPGKGACQCAFGGDCSAGGSSASLQDMAKHHVEAEAVGSIVMYLLTMCQHDGIADLLATSTDKTARVPLLSVLRGVRYLEPSGEFTGMDLNQATRMISIVDALRISKRGGQNVALLPRHMHLPSVAGLLQMYSAGTTFKNWRQGHSGAAWSDTEELLGSLPNLVVSNLSVPWFYLHLCLCTEFCPRAMLPMDTHIAGLPPRGDPSMDPLHQQEAREKEGPVRNTPLLGTRGSGAVFPEVALLAPPLPQHTMSWRASDSAKSPSAALLALRNERIHRETMRSQHACGKALLVAPLLSGVLRWGGGKRSREGPQDMRQAPWAGYVATDGMLDYQEQLMASMEQCIGVAPYKAGVAELYHGQDAELAAERAREAIETTMKRRALQGDLSARPMGGNVHEPALVSAAAESSAADGQGDAAGDDSLSKPSLSASGVMTVRSAGQGLLVEDLLQGGLRAVEDIEQEEEGAEGGGAGDSGAPQTVEELPVGDSVPNLLAWKCDAASLASIPVGVPGSSRPVQVRLIAKQSQLEAFTKQLLQWVYSSPKDTGMAARTVYMHATYGSQPVFTERHAGVLETSKRADTLELLCMGNPAVGWACLDLEQLWNDYYEEHGKGTEIAQYSATLARYLPWAREVLLDAFKGGLGEETNDTRLDVTRSPLQCMARLLLDPGVLKVTSALSLLAPVLDGDFGLCLAHVLDVGAACGVAGQQRGVAAKSTQVKQLLEGIHNVVVLQQPPQLVHHVKVVEGGGDMPKGGLGLTAAAACLPAAVGALSSLLVHAPHWAEHGDACLPLYGSWSAALAGQHDFQPSELNTPLGEWEGAPLQRYLPGCLGEYCSRQHSTPTLAVAYMAGQLVCLDPAPAVRRGVDLGASGGGGYRADSSVVTLPAWFQQCSFCQGHGHMHLNCPKSSF